MTYLLILFYHKYFPISLINRKTLPLMLSDIGISPYDSKFNFYLCLLGQKECMSKIKAIVLVSFFHY